MNLTPQEQKNKTLLQEKKPLVYNKILKIPEKIKNKESIALLQLQYNYICNFKCKHCAIQNFKRNDKSLTIKDVKSIADQADLMGLITICISGGEPLLFKDLEEVIKAIDPCRFNISMDTNGWFLTEEKIKWLVKLGIDRIHLSMDGLEHNHSVFRGANSSWQKCLNSLPYCKKHGLGTIINIVATKDLVRSGELVKQLEFIKNLDQYASIIYVKPTGAFEDHKDQILDTTDIEYIQTLTSQYNCSTHLSKNCGNDFGCLCVKRHFSITAYGDVLPCPWIPISLGNIHEEELQTIINRGLNIKWFSFDNKYSCLCGNSDEFFYKNILPQTEKASTYPISWRDIKWLV